MADSPGRYYEDYIGDGAYVYLSPSRDVVLYTSDGITKTNTVVMEPSVLKAFQRWLKRVEAEEPGIAPANTA